MCGNAKYTQPAVTDTSIMEAQLYGLIVRGHLTLRAI